jgi:RHS repeat-associated protein
LEYGGDTQRVLKNYNIGTNTNSRLYLHGANDYPLIEKNRVSVTAETLAVYIYGLNGVVAKRVGSTVLFLLKDHLGSTRVVMDATGLVRTYYDYDALGNVIRIGTTNEVKYQFTGQEYDESALHNYRARLYDSDLGKFYAIDPAEQGWAPFAYAGNNPVIMVDRDGKFFFIPILVGAGYGALAGGFMYSAQALVSENGWNLKGFGKAAVLGALSGAISGGIGQIGGPLSTNIGYSIVQSGANYAATTAVNGGSFSAGGFLGSLAGGVVGGFMPGFQGVEGGAIPNILSEMIHSTVIGSMTGGVSGSVEALIEGENIAAGWDTGLKRGALGGAIGAGLKIAAFGHTKTVSDLSSRSQNAIKDLNQKHGVGTFQPVFRSGGLYSLLVRDGITFGRNLLIHNGTDPVHEYTHYIQQLYHGYGSFYGRAMAEQWYWRLIKGLDIYSSKYLYRFMEAQADDIARLYP